MFKRHHKLAVFFIACLISPFTFADRCPQVSDIKVVGNTLVANDSGGRPMECKSPVAGYCEKAAKNFNPKNYSNNIGNAGVWSGALQCLYSNGSNYGDVPLFNTSPVQLKPKGNNWQPNSWKASHICVFHSDAGECEYMNE